MKHKSSFSRRALAIGSLILMATVLAFAIPTLLSPVVLVQNNATVTAGQLLITPAACDSANGNSYVATGREVLILQNTDTSPHTITITPVVDPYGGTNTSLTSYSLAASSISAIQMKFLIGWQSSGSINLTCTSNLIKFAVLQTN